MMARTPRVDKNGLRKGPWSKEEDDKLRAYISRYGHWNSLELPKFAGVSRCGRSCRLRWMNYLRPNIKHGNFTKEEEDLIMKMHNNIGNKWAKIAIELPGRSDNEIKNYWHTHLKKRVKSDQTDPENMHRETKIQTNPKNNFVESSDIGGHDEVEALCASSLELSYTNTHEYPNETNSSPLTPSSSSTSVELTSSKFKVHDSLISSSGDPVQTYSDEYDDGNFWTDPFFEDLDVVNNVFMALSDSDEFIWSSTDLYSEYHSQFMM